MNIKTLFNFYIMKERKFDLAIVISCIAIIISFIAIGGVYPRYPELGLDYQGWITGVLALLVTVLLGWNIYTLIDIKELRDSVAKEKVKSYIESEKNSAILCMGLSDFYYSILAGKEQPESEKIYKYVYYRISSLLHASRFNDFETCRVVAKVLFETIRPENIETSEKNKKYLFDLLSDVNEPRKVPHYAELLSWVARIKVRSQKMP